MLASPEGTARYASRFAGFPVAHWRSLHGLTIGSIGLGSYLGREDDAGDAGYAEATRLALSLGCNVLDTAINYRSQRSERALGRGLAAALAAGEVQRDEVVVCTKGGYLPFDGAVPADPHGALRAMLARYTELGLLGPGDVANGVHAIAPRFLEHCLGASLRNLGLDAVDVYHVHNPEEAPVAFGRDAFEARLLEAFAMLERACDAGRVGSYGIATWQGLRAPPGHPQHLPLQRIVEIAREARAQVGPGEPRFAVVQAPLNLAMTEALTLPTQPVDGRRLPLLEAAQVLGIAVVTSASILQGRLTRGLPAEVSEVLGLASDAHRALQFTRSCPGVAVALVGMGRPEHAEHNLALAGEEPAAPERLRALLEAAARV